MGAKGGEKRGSEICIWEGRLSLALKLIERLPPPKSFGGGKVFEAQAASWIACQMRCGVAGISIWVIP
jgi:hypothetical protein